MATGQYIPSSHKPKQTQTNKNQTRTSKKPDQEHNRANIRSTIFLQKNVQHSQSKCQSQISQIATLKCQENVTFLFQRKLKRLAIFDFSFIWLVSCRRLDEPHLRYHSSRKQPGVTTTKVPLISVSESPLICRWCRCIGIVTYNTARKATTR